MTETEPKTTTYSCRAEVTSDVICFLHLLIESLADASRLYGIKMLDDEYTCELEFTTTLDLDEVRALIDCVDDAHVMQETLRPVPLAENSLEREWATR